ncbi:hypothetical protein KC19_N039300 [Ceratodon purpureus]|nr:hypothetical protein KC19_N039300 [Ceratodon purpureus]
MQRIHSRFENKTSSNPWGKIQEREDTSNLREERSPSSDGRESAMLLSKRTARLSSHLAAAATRPQLARESPMKSLDSGGSNSMPEGAIAVEAPTSSFSSSFLHYVSPSTSKHPVKALTHKYSCLLLSVST